MLYNICYFCIEHQSFARNQSINYVYASPTTFVGFIWLKYARIWISEFKKTKLIISLFIMKGKNKYMKCVINEIGVTNSNKNKN